MIIKKILLFFLFFALGITFSFLVEKYLISDIRNVNPLARESSLKYKILVKKSGKDLADCLVNKNKDKLISCINEKLEKLSEKYGARFSLDALEPLAQENPVILSKSHDLAHTIGIYAVKHFETEKGGDGLAYGDGDFSASEINLINNIGKTLVDCDGWGAFGCYHGVIEVGLARLDPTKRTLVVKKACMENPLIQQHKAFKNQCLHWFGHGMAIFTDQTLLESLRLCQGLNPTFTSDDVQLCLSGVFHSGSSPGTSDVDYLENIKKVYSQKDVYFPCWDLPEEFKAQCFSHVPGRTANLENGPDLARVYKNCDNIPETDPVKKKDYVHRCYNSADNILLVNANFDPATVVADCHKYSNQKYLKYCYEGTVRYSILRDPLLNNEVPFKICSLVEKENKPSCYQALGAANYENYFDLNLLKDYCGKAESGYYEDCMRLDIEN